MAVTVTNAGGNHLRLDGTALGGAQASDFELTAYNVRALGSPRRLLLGVFVRFTPRGIGPRAAELAFDANTAAGHHVAWTLAVPEPRRRWRPRRRSRQSTTAAPTPSPTATPKPAPKPPSARVAIPLRSSFAPPPWADTQEGVQRQGDRAAAGRCAHDRHADGAAESSLPLQGDVRHPARCGPRAQPAEDRSAASTPTCTSPPRARPTRSRCRRREAGPRPRGPPARLRAGGARGGAGPDPAGRTC